MRVLVADAFQDWGLKALQKAGFELRSDPGLAADSLAAAVEEYDPSILIVRSTKVEAKVLKAGRSLKLVLRAGAGTDTIDIATASGLGIFVANCPGKNAIAVAELTWGLILSCDRRIPDQVEALRASRWEKKRFSEARGLAGRSLGLVGWGAIAREVAIRGKAFGMEVLVTSRSLTPQQAKKEGVGFAAGVLELAAQSDILSVHVAATTETRRLISRDVIAAMKDGATLINTSRGSLVDEDALRWGIETKGLRAGLDVYLEEPDGKGGAWDKPLARLPGVYGTHHIGASTDQAQDAIAAEAVRICEVYARTGEAPGAVNKASEDGPAALLTVKHYNRPGVLASLFKILGEAGINVEAVENVIFQGGAAACARIALARKPDSATVDALRSCNPDIIGCDL